ncbi:macrofage activating glycoprotein [Moniliophthora roreri MCA 2997]|uniref:Macrofage activating glycoprotein n=2 Tax=Moniliophthora roreri TaxID=221103 RepID=V2YL68_MONRO|nr:macrofage activating glycoprotein [Moniliophthora roreri MCA 2997]KAI3614072.1 macrophage activating glycoprotein [Moniliophthora roreri]
MLLIFSLLVFASFARSQTYSATYLPSNVPEQTEEGQTGTNRCGNGFNQTSMCQNAYINSVDDFCLWAPPDPGPQSVIGNTERIEVAWCIKQGYGTRLIPDGAITGAHFVQTPDFVQVTGVGNLTLLNIPAGDQGGELDPHGADGNGNPVGGLVFSNAFTGGDVEQLFEWTNFMSAEQFCFRACKRGPMAPTFCQHIYDVMGCAWNMPANYDANVFEKCQGESGEPMGVYGGSTFFQGQPVTPPAHPAPPSSNCQSTSTIGNGVNIAGTSILPSGVSASITSSGGTSRPTDTAGGASATAGNSAATLNPNMRGIYSMGLTFVIVLTGGAALLL